MATLLTFITIAIAVAGCSSDSGATGPPPAPAPNAVTAPTTQAPPIAASTPVRVQIPTIGVNSDLMALGRDLKPGDEGAVVRTDGTTAVVRVTQVEEHPETSFPTSAVYGDINHPGLRLVTCGGAFDQQAHSYIVW